jgi:hypothetical protein
MKKAILFLTIGLSAGLIAWKLTPSFIRELKQELM